uniref:Glucagon / GIP / secretin / VIP family domain-containing protein n=1 Tax=Astatotilapia calliptera TaxID=8154 RepID=A0A3P8NIS8_ASTCA
SLSDTRTISSHLLLSVIHTILGHHMVRKLKRHSDGTFTSDFTHYLDKIKAKDFVEWLTDPKQEGYYKWNK